MKRLVFFASGSGSNFQAVINAINNGGLDASIVGLISNTSSAGALERAQKHAIPTRVLSSADFNTAGDYHINLLQLLGDWKPHLIILAGYLQKIPVSVIDAYPNRIINIHPSLLPKYGGKGFYGKRVHEAVIAAGETESGCTVHVVTADYDQGPIIAQKKVPVHPGDTANNLATRVLEQEHNLLPQTIKQYLQTSNN